MIATAACSQRPTGPGASAPTADFADPGVDLPAAPARELLLSRCLGCHDLGGLDLFKDFYAREDWLRLLETMVAHGAAVDRSEIAIMADYLALYFGPAR